MLKFVHFLLLLAIVLLSASQLNGQDTSSPNPNNGSEGILTFYIPNFAALLDPFSFFDFSSPSSQLEIDSIESEIDQSSDQQIFFTFPDFTFFRYFWSSPSVIPDSLETDQRLDSLRHSQFMSCPVCKSLMKNVVELYPYELAYPNFEAILETECLEWGLPRSYCEMLIIEIVPEMIDWLEEGKKPLEYCKCSNDGTSEENPAIPDEDGDEESGDHPEDNSDTKNEDFPHPFIVILLCGVVFGIYLLTVRMCLNRREKNIETPQEAEETKKLIQIEESGSTTLPTYSEIQGFQSHESEPPKYAFSAQDAALTFNPYSLPPQYAPVLETTGTIPKGASL